MATKIKLPCSNPKSCPGYVYKVDRECSMCGYPVTPVQSASLNGMKEARNIGQVERALDWEDVDTTSGRHKAARTGEK
jgi:hypothetical protein